MTAIRTRTGVLALGLLVVLMSTGCFDESDVLSSGNIVASMPASTVNPSSIDYECISIDYTSMTVKPTDGICSADSDNAGRPCGTNDDCTNAIADCDDDFGFYCNGGVDDGSACNPDAVPPECLDGTCETAGQCITIDGMFTGVPCFNTGDCAFSLGAICGGSCSMGSPLAGQPCTTNGDCSTGTCDGAQASDALQESSVVVLTQAESAVAYFTPQCLRCEKDTTIPRYCQSDDDCVNQCKLAGDLPQICEADRCCEKPANPVLDPCTTDADCTNVCVDFWKPLPMNVLPEGRYDITGLSTVNIRMYAPDAVRDVTECISNSDVPNQFDPPLHFNVGPGLPNNIRSVIDIQALEDKLGLAPEADCINASENYPDWFQVVSE